jgi:SAM-dependent methyltransferase
MYERSAEVYDALRRGKDYAAACRQLRRIFERLAPEARTLLDVACGTGRHLEHLRDHYRAEGLDASAAMLTVAGRRCRDTPLHHCSMTDFCLGRTYDVVTCLFGSIGYALVEDRLRAAIDCLARAVRPGGIVVLEPWFEPGAMSDRYISRVTAEADGVSICRMSRTLLRGRVSRIEFDYLVGEHGAVRHFAEVHELGLFPRATVEAALVAAGLAPSYDEQGLMGRGLYLARRSAG